MMMMMMMMMCEGVPSLWSADTRRSKKSPQSKRQFFQPVQLASWRPASKTRFGDFERKTRVSRPWRPRASADDARLLEKLAGFHLQPVSCGAVWTDELLEWTQCVKVMYCYRQWSRYTISAPHTLWGCAVEL